MIDAIEVQLEAAEERLAELEEEVRDRKRPSSPFVSGILEMLSLALVADCTLVRLLKRLIHSANDAMQRSVQ